MGFAHDNTQACGATISNYLSDIRSRFRLAIVAPIPDSPLAALIVKRLRQLPRTKRFAEPAPSALIATLLHDDKLDLGVRAAVCMMWSLCLRVGTVTSRLVDSYDPSFSILRRDVEYDQAAGHITVHVSSSKSDAHNHGSVHYVLPTGGPGCPVRFLRRFLEASAWASPADPLFQWMQPRRGVQRLVTRADVGHALRVTGIRLGLDPTFLLPHSVRSGAATAAVTAGLSAADILLLGRWKSEASALCYLRLNVPRAQRIANALSLDHHFNAKGVLDVRPSSVFLLPTRLRRNNTAPA